MAEVITRFRVNCNGVEQDAQYCYKNLANKPTFKTINGKAIIVSSGDTETNFDVATQTDFTALANRVANIEKNGTGGGSGVAYDDTEIRNLITAEQNRATAKEAELQENINNGIAGLNGRVEELEASGGGNVDLSNYYKKTETYNRTEIDNKIASAGSGGTIDLSNYVDKSSQQTITGSKRFSGNVEMTGKLWDKGLNSGEAGQILSSTGNGVEWIDAPTGGGTTDLSNYYTKDETEALHNALVNKTGNQEISGEKNFFGKVSFYGNVVDSKGQSGTNGQVLKSTSTGVEWGDAPSTEVGKTFETVTMGGSIGATLDVNKVYSIIRCHQRAHDGVYFNIKNGNNCLEVGKVYNLKIMEFEIRDDRTIEEDGELDLNTYFRVQFENGRYTPLNFMPYIYVNSGSEILSGSGFVGLTEGTISNLEIDIVVESETSVKAYVIRPLYAE